MNEKCWLTCNATISSASAESCCGSKKKKRTKEAFAASHERVKSQSVTEQALKGQKEEMKRVLSCEG